MFMYTLKVVPTFYSLSTSILPFIFSTINLQILNPRPVPFGLILLCSFSLPKSIKMFFKFFLDMPTPAS